MKVIAFELSLYETRVGKDDVNFAFLGGHGPVI